MSIVRPPPIEPFHPLLKDAKPLLNRIPLPERHALPRHAQSGKCPRIPRPAVHQHRRRVCARPLHPSYETGRIVAVSCRRKRYPEKLPILRVDRCPKIVPRPLHLHLRLVDRDRRPVPFLRCTEQLFRPVIPLPCCLIRRSIEETEHLCRLPARQAIVQQRDSRSTELVQFGFRSRTKML